MRTQANVQRPQAAPVSPGQEPGPLRPHPPQGSARCRPSEQGAVTAEFAMILPVLFAVLLFGMWFVGVVVADIRCGDAARDVARAVARGEALDTAQQLGRRTAPSKAEITITRDGADVHVLVRSDRSPDWSLLRKLPPVRVKAEAILQTEPGTTGELP
jgi:hypothetical protein